MNQTAESRAGTMRSLLECSRPLNVLLVVPGVLLGAMLVGGLSSLILPDPWLAALAAALTLAAGNLWNDLADQPEDRINNPQRPLPSGRLSPRAALAASLVLASAGLAAGAAVSAASALLVACCAAALAFYARAGKGIPALGNLLVAALTGVAVLYGGSCAGSFKHAWDLAYPAFVVNLGRELIKDAADAEGDRRAGRRTLVMMLSDGELRLALRLVLALLPAYALLVLLFWSAGAGTRWTMLLVLLLVSPLALSAAWGPRLGHRLSCRAAERRLKLALALGLLCFIPALLLGR